MSRVLISLDDVHLTFGGKPLFEGVTLHICEGDKICLVGKNGAGKTTLMRLITEDLELDGGTRFALPGVRVGYLAQKVDFNPRDTVRQFILTGLPKVEHPETQAHLADIVMVPLELEADATMGTLSGGQLRRAALARALVNDPDVLLLDEPTNHLDITAIEWLEKYLASWRGALVCVSHDRAFLKAISRKVFWIDRGIIRTCPVGYEGFDDWMEEVLEQEAREIHNMERKLVAEVDWTQGGVTGRRKRNIRRLRELHRLRDKLKADKASYNQTIRTISLDPLEPTLASKMIAEFKHVSKAFSRESRKIPILKDFNLRILRGDRIGILGRNGSGKSTFLKLLVGELQPDEGRIWRGKNIDITYFDQNRATLDPSKTLWDTLCPGGGDHIALGVGENIRHRHVCAYLKDFLFDPKIARDKVGTLSGGQQNRLLLAHALAHPGNVLILDEPTNDLDMDTLDMLQELLAEFPGTLLIVSHDRDFLDRTVTKVLAFEGDALVEGYIGGYSDYLKAKNEKEGKTRPDKLSSAERSRPKAPIAAVPASASANTNAAARPAKMSFKLKHELETLPAKIAELEEQIAAYKVVLSDADLYVNDPKAYDTASRRLARAEHQLSEAETRWLELEEMRQNSAG